MSVAIVIPARRASSRFPGKPLTMLRGATGVSKPLVQRSWEAARCVPDVDCVIVATDDDEIAEVASGFGADVILTPTTCANGSERCAAALAALGGDVEIVVNLQGDAPLTPPSAVTALLAAMALPGVEVATPIIRATAEMQARLMADQRSGRVGGTTVVGNANGNALYFSKSVIPHIPTDRIGDPLLPLYLHLGVYAYRRAALKRYAERSPSALEQIEGLEQLRFLDAGIPVRLVEIAAGGDLWECNNPGDVAPIEAALAARGIG